MNIVFVVMLVLFLYELPIRADQISLIESKQDSTINVEEPFSLNDEEEPDVMVQTDDFQQMEEFMREENERLKDIKLLTLDVQKASLELKKKETDQKISQLTIAKDDMPSVGVEESVQTHPTIQLLGVFSSSAKKEAVLSINGKQGRVQQGEEFQGIRLVAVKSQMIKVEHQDGEIQELYL